jgi:hypothetical protein
MRGFACIHRDARTWRGPRASNPVFILTKRTGYVVENTGSAIFVPAKNPGSIRSGGSTAQAAQPSKEGEYSEIHTGIGDARL